MSVRANNVSKLANAGRLNNMQIVALNKSDINTSTPIGRLKQLIEDSDPLISDLAHSVVLQNNGQFVKKLISDYAVQYFPTDAPSNK